MLKGKKNHYNVKLLRGYGISISLKDSKIILKKGRHDVIGKQESESWFVNNMPYEKIVKEKDHLRNSKNIRFEMMH